MLPDASRAGGDDGGMHSRIGGGGGAASYTEFRRRLARALSQRILFVDRERVSDVHWRFQVRSRHSPRICSVVCSLRVDCASLVYGRTGRASRACACVEHWHYWRFCA